MKLSEKETALVLAGLRLLEYHWTDASGYIPRDLWNILHGDGHKIPTTHDIAPLCEKINCEPDAGAGVLVDALQKIVKISQSFVGGYVTDTCRIAESALADYDTPEEDKPSIRVFIESGKDGRLYYFADLDDLMGQLEPLSDEAIVNTELDGIVRRVGWEIG